MRVVYMAHPLSGDVEGNIRRAKQMLRDLEEKHPDVAIVATWITECEVWDDSNPEHREAGLRRDLAVIAKCDELWLTGPEISAGMMREAAKATELGIPVTDLTARNE